MGLAKPISDLFDRGMIVNEIAGEACGILFPEVMIGLKDLFGKGGERLAIDFHDDPVRGQMREHPIEGHALFDKKIQLGVFVEDDFGKQRVDAHDGGLAEDLHAVVNNFDFLARAELVELLPAINVLSVLLEASLLVVQ